MEIGTLTLMTAAGLEKIKCTLNRAQELFNRYPGSILNWKTATETIWFTK